MFFNFSNFSAFAVAILAFAHTSNSHLIMKTPVPFGVSTLNNSPLNNAKPGASDSDYPCKQRAGVYDITKMNTIAVDTPTEMSFEGSASHGGGTCQIAVTMDKEPTANSTFKIIQVFEGGCPINSDGNGATHPFSFSIPKEFPNGVMTLTWLWYNRIGNREAYMNCAPITVTGGSSSGQAYFDSLPNMYLINLPTAECQSTQDFASNSVKIPNPGQFFMQEAAGQSIAPASGPSCAASAAAMTAGVSGYKASPIITDNGAAYSAPGGAGAPAPSAPASASGYGGSAAGGSSMAAGGSSAAAGGSSMAAGGSSGSPSSAAAAPSSAAGSGLISMSVAPSGAAPSAPAGSAPASSATGSGFASLAPSSGAGIAGPSSAAASAAPSYAAPSAAPSGGAAAPSGQACSSTSMACSSDGKQFGLCANSLMVWQPVAPGTSCRNGQIVKRSEMRNVHVRRHAQEGRRHAA